MRVRGETNEALDLSDLLNSRYRSFLFFPTVGAVELNSELVAQSKTPIQLIVPDGTWHQARKVHSRHPELNAVPRVKISAGDSARLQLRAQHRPDGMATLEAIAHGLGVIEGDLVKEQFLKLYDAKVERTLMGRGLLRGGRAGFA